MCDIKKINRSDYDGNREGLEEFKGHCYEVYSKTWEEENTFNGKPIIRNASSWSQKERCFNEITEGHSSGSDASYPLRYETVPFFHKCIKDARSIDTSKMVNGDYIYFIDKRKVNILNTKLNYLLIIDENNKSAYVVTGYPVSEARKNKRIKVAEEYWNSL